MIFIIFVMIINSYYLPKTDYCHLKKLDKDKNNNKKENSNKDNSDENDGNENNSEPKKVNEGFIDIEESNRRFIKIKDLVQLEKEMNKHAKDIQKEASDIAKFKKDNKFFVSTANVNSYKNIKTFIEDEKLNPRYHEDLRESNRDDKIRKMNKDIADLKIQLEKKKLNKDSSGKIKNIKNYNAEHYIRVTQSAEHNEKTKSENRDNPFTLFINKGCASYDKESNNFKVSEMCNLSDKKQQFKLKEITDKNYNKEIDKKKEFLYSLPENSTLDQPFYIINPVEIDTTTDNKKCLTQLGKHLSVEPCNLHTNQRWIYDFKNKK